jgi:galactose mutarotase-like enzyme
VYQHCIWEDKFSFHELSQQRSCLKVVPARGGIITEWTVDGEAVLYLDPQTLLDTSKNIRGGIPILFPICGPLRDGQYQWEDQSYQMKQHGLARNLLWEVTGVEVSDGEALLSLETVANSETKLVYPFDFQLVFNYVLKPNSLLIKQSYLNNSAKVMPFYAGFHPYFYAPQRQGVKLNIPSQTRRNRNLLTGLEDEFAGCFKLEDVPEGNYVF